MTNAITAKFGGTSLACAEQVNKVRQIVVNDPRITNVVVSAPGKRDDDDTKLTDLLLDWHKKAGVGCCVDLEARIFSDRFCEIADGCLSVEAKESFLEWLQATVSSMGELFRTGCSSDFAASRGEHVMAYLMAMILNFTFVDAMEIIMFDEKGLCNWDHSESAVYVRLVEKAELNERFVVPGFYGCRSSESQTDEVRIFSRGGSDVTAAIVAAGTKAVEYQNWTDTPLLSADPRLVENTRELNSIDYGEVGEAAYMGMSAFHSSAIYPVRRAGIVTVIKNTNDPDHGGSRILPEGEIPHRLHRPTFVTGRKGFAVFRVQDALMNDTLGYGKKLLEIFEEAECSFESLPGGVDRLSVVVDTEKANKEKLGAIEAAVGKKFPSATLEVLTDVAMISVVGRGMHQLKGTAAKLFAALAEADINVRSINQDFTEINITIAVDGQDFDTAIRAIHEACVSS